MRRVVVTGLGIVSSIGSDELKELRTRIGFLFQSGALYDSMTVRENLAFPLTRVLNIKDEAEIEKRAKEVLDSVGLSDAIDKMPSELSGGMRKRMALARTLVVKPEIILYDEPTTGLDPVSRRRVWDDVRSLAGSGTTVFLTTQTLDEAEALADRIAVLSSGRIVADGTAAELTASVGRQQLILSDQQGREVRSIDTDGTVGSIEQVLGQS